MESRRGLRLDLRQLSLRSGATQLQARGQLWPRLAVASDPFLLGADLLTLYPALRQLLGPSARVNAELKLSGPGGGVRCAGQPLVGDGAC